MSLILNKVQEELEKIFKISCTDTDWRKDDGIYSAGDFYPVITNERPVKLQSLQWGFPIYLDDAHQILKVISEVGIELLFDKPIFECITDKRCLVPLELENNNTLLYGAGVWETFIGSDGMEKKCFSLLTAKSKNGTRVPFLLEGGSHHSWLKGNSQSKEDLQKFFATKTKQPS